jgi:hypothetical protein
MRIRVDKSQRLCAGSPANVQCLLGFSQERSRPQLPQRAGGRDQAVPASAPPQPHPRGRDHPLTSARSPEKCPATPVGKPPGASRRFTDQLPSTSLQSRTRFLGKQQSRSSLRRPRSGSWITNWLHTVRAFRRASVESPATACGPIIELRTRRGTTIFNGTISMS